MKFITGMESTASSHIVADSSFPLMYSMRMQYWDISTLQKSCPWRRVRHWSKSEKCTCTYRYKWSRMDVASWMQITIEWDIATNHIIYAHLPLIHLFTTKVCGTYAFGHANVKTNSDTAVAPHGANPLASYGRNTIWNWPVYLGCFAIKCCCNWVPNVEYWNFTHLVAIRRPWGAGQACLAEEVDDHPAMCELKAPAWEVMVRQMRDIIKANHECQHLKR